MFNQPDTSSLLNLLLLTIFSNKHHSSFLIRNYLPLHKAKQYSFCEEFKILYLAVKIRSQNIQHTMQYLLNEYSNVVHSTARSTPVLCGMMIIYSICC